MKECIIMITIIVIVFSGDAMIQGYLENSSNTLENQLQELKEKAIESKETENREEVKETFEKLEEEWEKTNKIWSVIVIHEELDNIEESLTKAKSSIYDGEVEEALEEIETAIFFIKHVREREKILLKNIF